MMLSKIESTNADGDGNSSNSQLLRDIEAIGKALYRQKTPQKALVSPSSVRSKSAERPWLSESKSSLNSRTVNASVSQKEKKSSSVWNWKKSLKALIHIHQQRFNICFFLHVHSVEGLPPGFNDMNLSVHWKRKDEVLHTRPSRVLKGIAEFDETLMHKCSVYGSKSGPHNSAKYETKLFLIYASVIGAVGVDMGKQCMDLTRLLPLTLEELEGEKSTGKWGTSFKLGGKANGATLNVSLGFSVVRDNLAETGRDMNVSVLVNLGHSRSCAVEQMTGVGQTNSNRMLRWVGSVPCDLNHSSHLNSQPLDVKICDEVSPKLGLELSKSISFLYQKLNEVNLHSSEEFHALSEYMEPLKSKPSLQFEAEKDFSGNEYYSTEFTVIEKGIEMSEKEDFKSEKGEVRPVDGPEIETINVDEITKDDDIELEGKKMLHSEDNSSDNYVDAVLVDYNHEGSGIFEQETSMKHLELAFNSFLMSESATLESLRAASEFLQHESYMETRSNCKAARVAKRSHSLDEITESVASDFLNMLGIDHSPSGLTSNSYPESPREHLLREFEKEAIASGNFIIEYDADGNDENFGCISAAGSDFGDHPKDFDLSMAAQGADKEQQRASQLLYRRRKAKVLEDLETEALMKKWGLNEEAFQSSPCYCSDGFGSPVELLPEDSIELPPLENGFGPFVQTKDGGYLRSMNPSLFRNSKNVGNLIMQVSRLVVLPAEMGSDIIEILQHLASIGIERLSQQVKKLMPLEDITGKTMQGIAQGAAPGSAVSIRQAGLFHESFLGEDMFLGEMGSDYVTLEHLSPLAMDKIEAMSIAGLRIQSGMSEEAVPPSIYTESFGKALAFEGKSANLGCFLSLEGAAELQALDARDSDSDFDRLLRLSVTLEDWLRLDAGVIDDEDQVSEHTIKILSAHHARCLEFFNGRLTRNINWNEASGRKHGLLGNNLIVVLMVLLRDPFRNYEPVGFPMLAVIQVERSFFHGNPKVHGLLSERSSNEPKDHEWINKEDANDDSLEEGKDMEEYSLGFKITEVHLSGLNTEPGKTQHWGTKMQQQYGVRWLHASGMSKSSKVPFSKSSAIVVCPQSMRRAQNTDFVWSISSRANGIQSDRKQLTGFVPHVRNPNVIFPK